jgi:hypothetical protein
MKKLLLCVATVAALSAPAFARLGETFETAKADQMSILPFGVPGPTDWIVLPILFCALLFFISVLALIFAIINKLRK